MKYIKASNSSSKSESSSNKYTQGLKSSMYLCDYAKVILTYNLMTTFGLCNGSTGIVIDIVYDFSSGDPTVNTKCVPDYIWVGFCSRYRGPSFVSS